MMKVLAPIVLSAVALHLYLIFLISTPEAEASEYELITVLEGFSAEVYLDSGGVPTVCYGHTGADVSLGQPPRTDEECDALLAADAAWASQAVSDLVTVPLSDNQRTALVSFVYNVGRSAFRDSTLLKLLNRGQYMSVPDELRRWVYDNGKRIRGLENRRELEIKVWNG